MGKAVKLSVEKETMICPQKQLGPPVGGFYRLLKAMREGERNTGQWDCDCDTGPINPEAGAVSAIKARIIGETSVAIMCGKELDEDAP